MAGRLASPRRGGPTQTLVGTGAGVTLQGAAQPVPPRAFEWTGPYSVRPLGAAAPPRAARPPATTFASSPGPGSNRAPQATTFSPQRHGQPVATLTTSYTPVRHASSRIAPPNGYGAHQQPSPSAAATSASAPMPAPVPAVADAAPAPLKVRSTDIKVLSSGIKLWRGILRFVTWSEHPPFPEHAYLTSDRPYAKQFCRQRCHGFEYKTKRDFLCFKLSGDALAGLGLPHDEHHTYLAASTSLTPGENVGLRKLEGLLQGSGCDGVRLEYSGIPFYVFFTHAFNEGSLAVEPIEFES